MKLMYTNLCTKQLVVHIAMHRFVYNSLRATVTWNSTFSDKFEGYFGGYTKQE